MQSIERQVRTLFAVAEADVKSVAGEYDKYSAAHAQAAQKALILLAREIDALKN